MEAGLAGLAFVLTVMWLSSYSFYTSLGLDMDRVEGSGIRFTYYRVRWPGDGSFRIGGGALFRERSDLPVEPFDLGGTFFRPPRRSEPRSFWNRIGFWYVDEPETVSRAQPLWARWIGIPSWLPALLAGVSAVLVARARRRQALAHERPAG